MRTRQRLDPQCISGRSKRCEVIITQVRLTNFENFELNDVRENAKIAETSSAKRTNKRTCTIRVSIPVATTHTHVHRRSTFKLYSDIETPRMFIAHAQRFRPYKSKRIKSTKAFPDSSQRDRRREIHCQYCSFCLVLEIIRSRKIR